MSGKLPGRRRGKRKTGSFDHRATIDAPRILRIRSAGEDVSPVTIGEKTSRGSDKLEFDRAWLETRRKYRFPKQNNDFLVM
jgi:hypothetical protein